MYCTFHGESIISCYKYHKLLSHKHYDFEVMLHDILQIEITLLCHITVKLPDI